MIHWSVSRSRNICIFAWKCLQKYFYILHRLAKMIPGSTRLLELKRGEIGYMGKCFLGLSCSVWLLHGYRSDAEECFWPQDATCKRTKFFVIIGGTSLSSPQLKVILSLNMLIMKAITRKWKSPLPPSLEELAGLALRFMEDEFTHTRYSHRNLSKV